MSKVTVRIDADEWYPVYSVHDTYGHEVEATPEQVERWAQAKAAFNAAQDEMGALYEVAETAARERAAREKAEKEAAAKAERARITAERHAKVEAQRKREAAMQSKIDASGGVLYDAEGNPVAVVAGNGPEVRLKPIE